MSIFLGEMLTDILDQLESGKPRSTVKGGTLDLGAHTLPLVPRHAGDRNRTSPFAFTGNKFEFRAVGSTTHVAWPNTVLNTMVAESLDFMATELEKRAGKKPTEAKLETAVRGLLKEVVKTHRRVCFDGDGYSTKWHEEAAKRGLANLASAADALPVIAARENGKLFTKYGVMSGRELKARSEVLLEQYCTNLEIEGRTLSTMVRTEILPSAIRAQAELADAVGATQVAGVECPDAEQALREHVGTVAALRKGIDAVDAAIATGSHAPEKRARHLRDTLVPAMLTVREASDLLESRMPADLWPLPTYAEMLLVGR
jgi:glutamine synthetase